MKINEAIQKVSVREALASYSHDAWAGWMKYFFSQCKEGENGEVIVPAEKVKRWKRQMETSYSKLPEKERPSDREQADKILAIVNK